MMNDLNSLRHPVGGKVKIILRLEGLCVLLGALLAYTKFGAGWSMFAWLFFVPDLSLLAYLAGPGIGAVLYNVTHSYAGPVMLLGAHLIMGSPPLLAVGLVWFAHIGFDRALGYGLKYPQGFRFTHLGTIGRQADGA